MSEQLPPTAHPTEAATTAALPTTLPYAADGNLLDGGVVRLPGYELLAELGRGGMGVVYKARHCRLNRLVAVKMILAGRHAGAADLARFQAESKAIARLQHPHIVQIHDVGEYEGKPYFSLEFCDGGALDRKLKGTPLPPAEAARLVITLAQAIQAAHDKQIVHRDLKPANVLLTHDGVPKITDFGLAKQLDGAGQTQSGAIMGTPSYMAPEQADGRGKQVGPAADVYALGAILYECLTGRPPFKAATSLDTLLQVLGDDPVPPRQLQSKIPRDLETICLKCLRKEPEKRYASAAALAEDLARFRDGRPIAARRVSRLEHGWRWCRRNPVVALLILLVFVSMAAGSGAASWYAVQAHDEAQQIGAQADTLRDQTITLSDQANTLRDQTVTLSDKTNKLRDEALNVRHLYDTQANQVQLTWEQDHPERIPQLLDAQRPDLTDGIDLRGFEWYFWSHRRRAELLDCSTRQGQAQFCDTNGLGAVVVVADKGVVWDVTTGKVKCRFKMPDAAARSATQALSLSPNSQFVAAGGEYPLNNSPKASPKQSDFSLHLWDAATGAELHARRTHRTDQFPRLQQRWSLPRFDEHGRHSPRMGRGGGQATGCVAVGDFSSPRSEPRQRAGRPLQQAPYLAAALLIADRNEWPDKKRSAGGVVAFAPEGRQLVWARDGRVSFWDWASGTAVGSYAGNYRRLTFSPDGKQLAGESDLGVKLLEAKTGRELAALQGKSRGVTNIAFSPDGKRLTGAILLEGVKVWSTHKGEELFSIHPKESVFRIAFSPDDQRLVGVGQYKIHVWNAATDPGVQAVFRGSGALAFSPDGTHLASTDSNLHFWDVANQREERVVKGPPNPSLPSAPLPVLAYSPDGRHLAAAYRDGRVQIWDTTDGKNLHTFQTPQKNATLPGVLKPRTLRFSPDGRQLLWAWCGPEGEREVGAWNVETGAGEWHHSLPKDSRMPGCPALSPDGQQLAIGSADPLFHMNIVDNEGLPLPATAYGPVQMYAAKDGKLLFPLDAAADFLTFNADGGFLAGGHHSDNSVIVWDARNGKRIQVLGGYQTPFTEAEFSPDGRRLAAVSAEGVRVWNLATGNEVLSVKGVIRVQFSPDGRYFAGMTSDGNIKVWKVGPRN